MTPRRSRRPPDPNAPPRRQRHHWAPAMVTSELGEDRDIEREMGEIVTALRDHGPMRRRDLARAVESRFWGPGRLSSALWLAQRRGMVRRSAGRFTVADGD